MTCRSRVATVMVGLLLASTAACGTAATNSGSHAHPTSHAPSTLAEPGQMSLQWRLVPNHTSSRKWTYENPGGYADPGLPLRVPSSGLLTLTLSANLSGVPVQFRMTDNTSIDSPRVASFDPRTNSGSFGFTFSHVGKPTTCGHTPRLEWRSPSGRPVSLRGGVVVVTYTPQSPAPQPCP